jgi:putative chitinase
MITAEELRLVCPTTKKEVIEQYVEPLNAAMLEFEIDNPVREAMFIAQLAHESGGFHYVKELATGRDYEGRIDLGNIYPGDGVRYKGRGLIQITGRSNYHLCSMALFGDKRLLDQPELLEQPLLAARSAAWFWKEHGLNELADNNDFKLITKRINGGYNGYQDRLAMLARAQRLLGADGAVA